MKKTFLLALTLMCLYSTNSFSQTFTFVRTSAPLVDTTFTDSSEIWSYGIIHNSTSNPITFHVVIYNNSVPSGWDSTGWCSWQLCYGTGNYAIDVLGDPGDNDLHAYFEPYMHPGTASCTITVTANGTSISQTFMARNNPIGIQPISTIAKDFSLGQNYPNPFNPNTKINFSIPKSEFTYLRVYDILGREVRTLVAEQLHSGEYQVDFDAKDLSSGMYYYSL